MHEHQKVVPPSTGHLLFNSQCIQWEPAVCVCVCDILSFSSLAHSWPVIVQVKAVTHTVEAITKVHKMLPVSEYSRYLAGNPPL